MKPWNRWQDWAIAALGLWLFLSPWLTGYAGAAADGAWTSGLFVVVMALWALLDPVSRTPEAGNVAFGAWIFFVPFMLGFGTASSVAAWNAWIVGAAVAMLAVWSIEKISVATAHHVA